MDPTANKSAQPGALDLLDESVHLLRQSPVAVLACYAVGTLPFVLAALYFVADMSLAGLARQRLASEVTLLAALFVWMKCWQCVFAQRLLAQRHGEEPSGWSAGRVWRMVTAQAAIQPLGLALTPLSLVALVPFPWVYAYFHAAMLAGDGTDPTGSLRRVHRQAFRQASRWPWQNVVALLAVKLFALFALMNWILAIYVLAYLTKALLGVDTPISRGGFSPFNTTFMSVSLGLTFLCVDPVIKAFYVLRSFYGPASSTGVDLLADLRLLTLKAARPMVILALVGAAALWTTDAVADQPVDAGPPTADTAAVQPAELDDTIRRVIQRREYVYRMPPEKQTERADSWWDRTRDWLNRWLDRRADRAARDRRPRAEPRRSSRPRGAVSFGGLAGAIKVILWIVVIAGVAFAVVWGVLSYRRRRKTKPVEAKEVVAKAANIRDEDVMPDQFPADDWLAMARDLIAQGQRQLAVRAIYLASLSLLGEHNIIAIRKFKSNYEYGWEVQRRAHALPELVEAFGKNVRDFEDAWYGLHDVTDQTLKRFMTNATTIRQLATA
ncbi:MAG: DUF4129 domain-containing protein [Planctomycetota bacterium]|jgi:hypothetical protein